MDSIGPTGKCHVNAVIYDERRTESGSESLNFPCLFHEKACGYIFFTQLYAGCSAHEGLVRHIFK
jgi:hypothetical protein